MIVTTLVRHLPESLDDQKSLLLHTVHQCIAEQDIQYPQFLYNTVSNLPAFTCQTVSQHLYIYFHAVQNSALQQYDCVLILTSLSE